MMTRRSGSCAGVFWLSLFLVSWSCGPAEVSPPVAAVGSPAAPVVGASARPTGGEAGFDVSGIIDKVGRALLPLPDRPGVIGTEDAAYRFEVVGAAGELTARGASGATALRFETQSILLGEREVAPADSITADGNALVVSRGAGVVERITARRGEVEQTWELPSAPGGGADAVFFVAMTGLPYAGESLEGVHFLERGPNGGPGFRYGHATAIDARGQRLPVPVRGSDEGVVVRVPGDWLAAAAYPVVVDPIFKAEFAMDVPIGSGSAGGIQRNSAVAFGGGNFLVVWEDQRAAPGDSDIFGARVSTSGAVLDTGGIAVAVNTATNQLNPDVAFDGTNFLVVWDDNRANPVSIYGARIDAATGTSLDPGGVQLATGVCSKSVPAVAFSGSSYLVAFQAATFNGAICAGNSRIQSTVVTTAGTSTSLGGTAVATGTNVQAAPDVTWNGQNFIVVWQEQRATVDMMGARVDAAGTTVAADAAGKVVSGGGGTDSVPAVTSDGNNVFVAWQDNRNGTNDILGCVVDRNMATPAGLACPIDVDVSAAGGQETTPAVAWAGSYLVAWQTSGGGGGFNVRGRRYDSAGAPFGAGRFDVAVTAADQTLPAVAGGTTLFLGTWTDARGANPDVYGTIINGDTVATPGGARLSDAYPEERAPAVASDGTGYLVVWQDLRNGADYDIVAVPVTIDAAGEGVPGTPLGVATNPTSPAVAAAQIAPAVAYGGGRYLVVWQDNRGGTFDIFGARITTTGTFEAPSDQNGFVINSAGNDQITPSVSYNFSTDGGGREFMVVWDDARNLLSRRIFGVSVTGAGALVGGGFQVSATGGNHVRPDVAMGGATGGTGLVVFRDETTAVIRSHLVDRAGELGGDLDLHAAGGGASRDQPAVSWNGTHWLAVWQDAQTQVRGQRLNLANANTAGLVGGNFDVSTAAGGQTAPDVAWDGSNDWYVVWQDGRNGNGDIFLNRVTAAGTVRDGNGFAVLSGTSAFESAPAIATRAHWEIAPTDPNRRGRALLVYEAQRGGGAARVYGRPMHDLPNGRACSSASECDSNICVDGVCCASACGNGSTGDCQACSAAAGLAAGNPDGTCGPTAAGTTCRAGNGVCDPAETCDGVLLTCPANAFASTATPCGDTTFFCRVGETCDGVGACNPSSGTTRNCSDGNPCHAALCNEATDACDNSAFPPGTSCEGTFFCTTGEVCNSDGLCDPSSGIARNCGDGNLCHKGVCDEAADSCDNGDKPLGASCEGTFACRLGETCNGVGGCDATTGTVVNCSDGTACTTDSCTEPGGCVNAPVAPGASCEGELFCRVGETCMAGGACDPGSGVALVCNDGNVCHVQICDEAADVCTFANVADGVACADATVCNGEETCRAGTCTAGTPLTCSDGNPCTQDTCDPSLGCRYTVVSDGTSCADADLCDGSETCTGGVCAGGVGVVCSDGDPCTVDSCTPATGMCVYTPDPTMCIDGGVDAPEEGVDADSEAGSDVLESEAQPGEAGFDATVGSEVSGSETPAMDAQPADMVATDARPATDATTAPDGARTDGSTGDATRDGSSDAKPPGGGGGGGCGCGVGGDIGGGAAWLLALLGLATVAIRRRGRR